VKPLCHKGLCLFSTRRRRLPREGLRARNAGPHRANQGLAAYLRREQELGRIDSGEDSEAAAALLLGACQQRAVHALFIGADILADQDGFANNLVKTLMHGLSPHKG
jgi:hypothetical protein